MRRLRLWHLVPALASLVFVLSAFGQSTAFAAGGKSSSRHNVQNYSSTCPGQSTSNYGYDLPIYQVSASSSVNVRQGPGTGYCVITTQSPGGDVLAVTNSSGGIIEQSANGYTWLKVLYFEGNSAPSANYSFGQSGWMAINFLARANTGFKCLSSGCDEFQGGIPNQWQPYVWEPGNEPPSPYPSTCNGVTDSNGNTCYREGNGYQYSFTSPFADPSNPNWFMQPCYCMVQGYVFFWNYDWWAH